MLEIIPAILVFVATFLVLLARNSLQKNKVGVIVLGDIGRSPRMREHCLSLTKENFQVQYIAVRGSEIHGDLLSNEKINISLITPFPSVLPRFLTIMVKPIIQTVTLLAKCLYKYWGCSSVLMQNPPTIPVIGVVWFVCKLYGARMIIDWHNYGYTILALGLHDKHILVKIAQKIEQIFGRLAHDNFCVTNAMSRDLNDNWGIKAYSLYDRPTHTITSNTKIKHTLFLELSKTCDAFRGERDTETAFTISEKEEKTKRPILIVSSTSWTPDEDFSVLLGSLQEYDRSWSDNYPDVVCAITGKGPLRSYYEEEVRKLALKHVKVVTLWLKPEQYPLLLASADLGVSLHYSSSGLDLPMKVVDMYGAGIPVCARNFKWEVVWHYLEKHLKHFREIQFTEILGFLQLLFIGSIKSNSLHELVRHGKNGCVFEDSNQLYRQLITLFKDFPNGSKNLSILREGVKHFQSLPWHYHWKSVALPVFNPHLELEDYGDEIGPSDIGMMNINPNFLRKLRSQSE